ncbi:MAG TPA: hypothetical protein VKO83_09535 [Steroidobacteraceae bacterium]|nr:hypothetical protein [Steroidobacteraceae bacterium]
MGVLLTAEQAVFLHEAGGMAGPLRFSLLFSGPLLSIFNGRTVRPNEQR